MNKKRVIKTTAFLLIFVICFITLTYEFRTNSNNTRAVEGLYAERDNSLDVIYVGASSVKTNFSAPYAYKHFGFAGYSMSFDGTAFEMLETLAREALSKQSPKVLLFDLRPVLMDLTNQKSRAVIDNIKWSDNKKEAIEKFGKDDSKISFYLTLDKYHSRWKDLSSVFGYTYYLVTEPIRYSAFGQYSLKEMFIDKKHILKGFFTTNITYRGDHVYEIPEEFTGYKKLSDEKIEAIHSLTKYLKDNNIEAKFLISPALLYYMKDNEASTDRNLMLNYAKKIIEDDGFECLDWREKKYFDDMKLDMEEDFGDDSHMNVNGALKYTYYLSKYLTENYDLPDHRGDKVYDNDWQKAVNVMQNVIKVTKAKDFLEK